MAQYGRNFYGSIYYGPTTAFSSVYTSKAFDAEEPLTGPIQVEVSMVMPKALYGKGDKEISLEGSWTGVGDMETSDANARLSMVMSASSVNIVYLATTLAQTIRVKVESVSGTVLHDQVVSTQGSGEDFYSVPSFPYQEVVVEVTPVDLAGAPMVIRRLEGQVTSVTMEIGHGADKDGLSYEEIDLTLDNGLYKGVSTSAAGSRYVRFRLHLASSDDSKSPRVDSVKMTSGDVSTRASDGYWTASIDMVNLASAAGVTFKDVQRIDWVDETPVGTSIEYRSRGAANAGSTTFGPETAVYRKGYTRLRLPDTATEGYVLMKKPVDPLSVLGRNFNKILGWTNLYPLISTPIENIGGAILLEFYETRPDESQLGINSVASIDISRSDAKTALQLFNRENEGKSFYLGIRLKKKGTSGTPIVDLLTFESDMRFLQDLSRSTDEISAVDSEDGTKMLWALNGNEYAWPNPATGNTGNVELIGNARKTIEVIDESNREGLELYFESKQNESEGRNLTSLQNDKIVGKVNAIEPSASSVGADASLPTMHYHYNGGRVAYGFIHRRRMASDFTPSLLSGKRYRYRIVNGREAEKMRLETPMSWTELAEVLGSDVTTLQLLNPGKMEYEGRLVSGQEIVKPDTRTNENAVVSFDGAETTSLSTHNGAENAYVRVELSAPTLADEGYGYGLTGWKSEEKIYQGFLNVNDIRSPYVRRQLNTELSSAETEHVVKTGETYASIATEKKVDVEDLMHVNKGVDLEEGMRILIPAVFGLPRLASEAIFQDENGEPIVNPYQIEIIPGSVKKATGERLADDTIVIGSGSKPGIIYTTRESSPVSLTLTRGPFLNGRDLLGHRMVKRVISIVDENMVSYTPYVETETTKTGDFVLEGNYIWWKGTQQGSKEPAEGVQYTVTYTYDEVYDVEVTLDSSYVEKAGYDILWRSPEVKVYEGIASPLKDFKIGLPAPSAFEGFSERLEDVSYVVEDNDPWVKTEIVEENGEWFLVGTLDGEDPEKNWYPEIEPGYYYLGRQKHYMYAEPLRQTYGKESVPVAKNVRIEKGTVFIGKGTTNLLQDGKLETTMPKQKEYVYQQGDLFLGFDI